MLDLTHWLVAIAWLVPACLALGALLLTRIGARDGTYTGPHLGDLGRSGIATLTALAALVMASATTLGLAALPNTSAVTTSLTRVDVVSTAMLLLVALLGAVILHFSRSYLSGERDVPSYERRVLTILALVSALVLSQNLVVIALAWTFIHATVQPLLTFYPDRTRARVAAHQRAGGIVMASVLLWSGVLLVFLGTGTLQLEQIAGRIGDTPEPGLQLAAICFAAAALITAAQLPFHGWLVQVVEAPTPVSALLHAGVVNIGGIVLIRLAPLLSGSTGAQILLVAVGASTAFFASLARLRCSNVKVSLAWSTSAQMGLMLIQCGLGAWHLALLHIVAHSLYKAHGFLSAGGAVQRSFRAASHPRLEQRPSASSVALGVACAAAGLALMLSAGIVQHVDFSLAALALILALAVESGSRTWAHLRAPGRARVCAHGTLLASLYFGAHSLAEWAYPNSFAANAAGWWLVAVSFAALLGVQAVLVHAPHSTLGAKLRPLTTAGDQWDALWTRTLFRLWPPSLPTNRTRHAELDTVGSRALKV